LISGAFLTAVVALLLAAAPDAAHAQTANTVSLDGADTKWNNGLLGIALSQASGKTDFAAHGIAGTLESDLAGAHPYLTRALANLQLWATAGIADGEAQLREGGGSADAGLSLLSAAAGVVFAPRANASFHAAGRWSRAKLDAATFPDGRELPKVTAAATTATTGDAGDGGGVLSRV